jgi:uncharacterized protein
MDNTIQQKIIDYLKPVSEGRHIADVRIGLGYTSVKLDNGKVGLAWTGSSASGHCTHMPEAGTLAGRASLELLEMLASERNTLARTIGLATANALVAGLPRPETTEKDVLDIVNIHAGDQVVMVGFFGPVIPKLKQIGCRLDILELDKDKPSTIYPDEGLSLLASCSVAIITATSIITGTLDGLLASLGKPRAVILLGPSSIMCPQIFAGMPVTHIGGARVLDPSAVEKIVSEGGGTMILKKHMIFETICL